MALNQDNLNLPLCLPIKHKVLRSLSSSLRSLKLIILIFSSMHKLHLLLKLFAVEDCLTIFHFYFFGVSPWFQKYLDGAVWFLSDGLEKRMSVVIETLFPIPSGDINMNPLLIIIIFHWGNARLVYDVLRVALSAQEAFFLYFYSYRTPHLVPYYSYLIFLVTSYCGCLRYYAYCLYQNN